jgi:hypothetical protein
LVANVRGRLLRERGFDMKGFNLKALNIMESGEQ